MIPDPSPAPFPPGAAAGDGPPAFDVREAGGADDVAEVRRLVLEHAAARATTPGVEYMRADGLAMPGPYVPPRGGLWLARARGAHRAGVGCVALRPIEGDAAEVKRMYVTPTYRGLGVGRALLVALIAGARARGYPVLRLGTLDDMTAAQALYDSLGFRPIERYRPDELVDTRFYELRLTPAKVQGL